jgi:hypothetical protein
MEAPKTHDVRIVVGKNFCEIEPGDVFATNGDSVTFTNDTAAPVTLFFGNRALFDREMVRLEAGQVFGPIPIGKIPPPRSFQYAVYSDRTGAFGVGGSSPRIIIMQ